VCGRGVCVGGGGLSLLRTHILEEIVLLGCVCVFITAGPITKLCAWAEEDSGGHVLCEVEIESPRFVSCSRERVLFIGTQFSILYTSMYSPAEAATPRA
jgi:hypothetical protein